MGWWGLIAMFAEDAVDVEQLRPTVCPTSGDLLVSNRDGDLICPYDGQRF